jgi:hypothetical protein
VTRRARLAQPKELAPGAVPGRVRSASYFNGELEVALFDLVSFSTYRDICCLLQQAEDGA